SGGVHGGQDSRYHVFYDRTSRWGGRVWTLEIHSKGSGLCRDETCLLYEHHLEYDDWSIAGCYRARIRTSLSLPLSERPRPQRRPSGEGRGQRYPEVSIFSPVFL